MNLKIKLNFLSKENIGTNQIICGLSVLHDKSALNVFLRITYWSFGMQKKSHQIQITCQNFIQWSILVTYINLMKNKIILVTYINLMKNKNE